MTAERLTSVKEIMTSNFSHRRRPKYLQMLENRTQTIHTLWETHAIQHENALSKNKSIRLVGNEENVSNGRP